MSSSITEFIATELLPRLLLEADDDPFDIFNNNETSVPMMTPRPTSAPGPPNGGSDGGRGAYEFVAFILWYLFLVLCCIVPTCCAYRRRRMLEARYGLSSSHQHPQHATAITLEQLQQLQHVQQLQNGMYLLPSLQQRQELFRSTQELMESDTAKIERTKRIEESLDETTFIVQDGDVLQSEGIIVSNANENDPNNNGGFVEGDEKDQKVSTTSEPSDNNNTLQDMEEAVLADLDVTTVLRLPSRNGQTNTEYINGNRTVPGVCAICLCGYEVDDKVTWSKESNCQHVFHHECIVPWLAKKNEGQPKCPCCRQVYCNIEPVSLSDIIASSNSNNEMNGMDGTTTLNRTSGTATLTPFEFMMAVRSGGNSIFFPQDFTSTRTTGAMASQGTPFTVVAHYNSPYSSSITPTTDGSLTTPTPINEDSIANNDENVNNSNGNSDLNNRDIEEGLQSEPNSVSDHRNNVTNRHDSTL